MIKFYLVWFLFFDTFNNCAFVCKGQENTNLTKEFSIEEVILQNQLIQFQEMKEIKQLILEIKNQVSFCPQAKSDEENSAEETLDSKPADCSELLEAGHTVSGVYKIYPSKPAKVFCDMETNGGGWTVFLSRMNTSKQLNFFRNWEHYKNGFGTAEEEYWLGNEVLHTMTSAKNYSLRMEAKDKYGSEIWGEWNSFSVASEIERYRLVVTSYISSSTAFDAFTHDIYGNPKRPKFSTFDMDNDKYRRSCSQKYKGGWWYDFCHSNNPTGIYGRETNEGIRIRPWSKTDELPRHATWLQMKIRPKV